MILEVGVVIDVTEAMKIEIAEEKEVERKKMAGNQKKRKERKKIVTTKQEEDEKETVADLKIVNTKVKKKIVMIGEEGEETAADLHIENETANTKEIITGKMIKGVTVKEEKTKVPERKKKMQKLTVVVTAVKELMIKVS